MLSFGAACGVTFTGGEPDEAGGGQAGDATGGAPAGSPGGSAGAGGGMGGTGGVDDVGCSDGTREGFLDIGTHPDIAACDGGWSIPGLVPPTMPQCGRVSGNSSANPDGSGCAADDLCAPGWEICASKDAVAQSSPTDCESADPSGDGFYATRQSGTGANSCAPTGTDDLFGCGSLGFGPNSTCDPLDAAGANMCEQLPETWYCGDAPNAVEAELVTKASAADGGVLCCRR